jgi:hypothetical protein
MKQQVKDFQEKMGQTGPQTTATHTEKPSAPKAKAGDYIDFEEIRN